MTTRTCPQCGANVASNYRFCPECGAEITRPAAKNRSKSRSRKKRQGDTRTPNLFAILAIAGGVLLLLVVGAFVIFGGDQPDLVDISEIPDAHNEEGIPYPEVPRILLEQARARYDAGSAIFVDVRSLEEYEAEHIPNAVSIPAEELGERYSELLKNAEIITYCT